MSNIALSPVPWFTETFRWWRYQMSTRLARIHRAYEYATGRLSPDNAQDIMLDCRDPAGWYPLLILDVQDTLKDARELFADHPALPHLIEAACSCVASKWEDGDAGHEARRWAIEIARDYAAQTIIALIPWTEILPPLDHWP